MHADRPNELPHFDFCFMGRGEYGEQYSLVVKNDLSNYVWLRAVEESDAETAADVLSDWFAAFGILRSRTAHGLMAPFKAFAESYFVHAEHSSQTSGLPSQRGRL